MLKTLPRRKIRDTVADQLKTFIRTEKLLPGARLPTETKLATMFGVSRLSVREATKALEFLGIVESRTGVGLTVGKSDLQRVTGHLGFYPALHHADPRQLIESRIVVEVGVLPHIARRMADDQTIHQTLQDIVNRSASARKLEEWIDLDIEFHHALLDASGLAPLIAFGDLLQVFFQQFRESVKRAEWKEAIASHQRMIDALANGDVEIAGTELNEHIVSHMYRSEVAS